MGVHDGHRERLKKRFSEHGLDSFTDHEALELLMFYSVSRRDTNETAHRLVKHFGSLKKALEADMFELTDIDGVGENTALLIKLVYEMGKRCMKPAAEEEHILRNSADIIIFLRALYAGETRERMHLTCLNGDNKVISCNVIADGSPDTVGVEMQRLLRVAAKTRAVSAVLSHNHVGRSCRPSAADKSSTLTVRRVLDEVGVTLLEHVIISEDDFAFLD